MDSLGQSSLAAGNPWELLGPHQGQANPCLSARPRQGEACAAQPLGALPQSHASVFTPARGAMWEPQLCLPDPHQLQVSRLRHAGPLQPPSPKGKGSNFARGNSSGKQWEQTVSETAHAALCCLSPCTGQGGGALLVDGSTSWKRHRPTTGSVEPLVISSRSCFPPPASLRLKLPARGIQPARRTSQRAAALPRGPLSGTPHSGDKDFWTEAQQGTPRPWMWSWGEERGSTLLLPAPC